MHVLSYQHWHLMQTSEMMSVWFFSFLYSNFSRCAFVHGNFYLFSDCMLPVSAGRFWMNPEFESLITVRLILPCFVNVVPLPYSRRRSSRYSDNLHVFFVTIPRCCKDVYVNSLFPRTARLWNSLPIECCPLTYDLNGFNSRINAHLLSVGND